jgi:uncharacterized phage protein (TIGR02218 family)
MAFDTFERADGRPTELYQFVVGSSTTRYTSASVDQQIGGNTYETLAIQRTDPAQSKDVKAGEIILQVPASLQLVLDFRAVIPYSLPSLTIFRIHQQDSASIFTFWKGFVSSVAMSDTTAEIACQPVDRVFNRQIPRFVYSGICNHVLYDGGCLLSPTDFDFVGVANSINTDGTEIVMTGARAAAAAIAPGLSSAELDVFWQGGYMETPGGAERRMILEGNVGGDADKLRILLRFRDLVAGGNCTVFAGCDHSLTTCDAKFNNVLRFGGYPFVPTVNPFAIDLDGGS